MHNRKYYEAYDDRYTQVHSQRLRWFSDLPSGIVREVIARYDIKKEEKLLEIGCGEGRDAVFLLKQGYDLLATDISPAAIHYCRTHFPAYREHFQVLDCIRESIPDTFAFIYAVAVVHMLVEDADRMGFYRFIRSHLAPGGIALICTMGDGTVERKSDTATAFALQTRIHTESGQAVRIAETSCRVVSFNTLHRELAESGLRILHEGMTAVEPDFPQMMYAVVTAS